MRLEIPTGIPPVHWDLTLEMHDPATGRILAPLPGGWRMATIQVSRPLVPPRPPRMAHELWVNYGGMLQLVGYEMEPFEMEAADEMRLELLWRVWDPPLPLVEMVLEGSGFDVVDLGVDVHPEKFIEAIRQHKPDFVGLSALLTTTMPAMQTTIDTFKDAGIRDQAIVMVGGAPVNQAFADKIWADIYAPNAASAANKARAML